MAEGNNPAGITSWIKWLTAALAAGVVVLAGVQFYTFDRLTTAESELAALREQQAESSEGLAGRIEELRASGDLSAQQQAEQIEAAQTLAQQNRQRTRDLASQLEEDANNLKALRNRVDTRDGQIESAQSRLQERVGGVEERVAGNSTGIDDARQQIEQVGQETAAIPPRIDQLFAQLEQVTGDLGMLSGRIATNAQELEALKQIDDREYVEFTLFQREEPARIADIDALLTQVNPERGTYSLELQIDGHTMTKTGRTVNEPLQFYTQAQTKQPHELVINEVAQGWIRGYLAMPQGTEVGAPPPPDIPEPDPEESPEN